MARKPKKKVARKKVVSQPRKAGSRPVWALVFFCIGLCSFVAIWDFELAQSRVYTTEPEMNLVGVFGAEVSFWAFHFIGVATWLIPLYLLWAGVRFILQQQPRRRMVSGVATVGSLMCASGLAAMMEVIGTVKIQDGYFCAATFVTRRRGFWRICCRDYIAAVYRPLWQFLDPVDGVRGRLGDCLYR